MKMTLWRDEAVVLHPVTAAAQRHDARTRLFLRVEHGGVMGFGEIDPQPFSLNGDPGFSEVVQELDGVVLLQVQGAFEREGGLPSWTRIARFAGSRPGSSPAVCLVEMALLDRELRAQGRSILSLWPAVFDTPVQSTVSLLDDEEWVVDPGVARLRVKTSPGAISAFAMKRLAALRVPVLLDFNCSATSDADVIGQLAQIGDAADVAGVEQPFAPGNVVDHARLAEQIAVPLSIDEGIRNVRDLEQVVRYSAASIVCVKPARVGGYANARTIIARSKELGLRPYLGGFFESPFARRVNRLFAQHSISEPSDIGLVETMEGAVQRQLESVPGGFETVPSKDFLDSVTLIASFG
jgi:L-alanine-DL-glutamate epimerase-like enolase superfamily enzyme